MNKAALRMAGAGLLAAVMSGCASTPGLQAENGDPRPLMELVMSGQVGPNEYVPVYDGKTGLPICRFVMYTTAAPAVDWLLRNGAELNKPCTVRTDGTSRPGDDDFPLDSVWAAILFRGLPPGAYGARNYRPELLPTFFSYADKIIQRGGTSKNGPMTVAQLREKYEEALVVDGKFQEELKADLREKEKNSIFNADTLKGVATIAGMAANNYGAAKAANRQAAVPLPIADVKTIPPQTATQAPSTSRPQQGSVPQLTRQQVPAPATRVPQVAGTTGAAMAATGSREASAPVSSLGNNQPPPRASGVAPPEARTGTVYYMVHALVISNRAAGGRKALFAESVIPVDWTWARNGPVFDEEIVRAANAAVKEAYQSHLARDYPRCSPSGSAGECWGTSVYLEYGRSESEVQAKQSQRRAQSAGSKEVERDSFTYRTSITVR